MISRSHRDTCSVVLLLSQERVFYGKVDFEEDKIFIDILDGDPDLASVAKACMRATGYRGYGATGYRGGSEYGGGRGMGGVGV